MMMMKTFVWLAFMMGLEPSFGLLGGLKRALGRKSKITMPKVDPEGKRLPPVTLDNKNLDYIFMQNQAWKNERLAGDKNFFKTLGSYHAPEYMYIGKHHSCPSSSSFVVFSESSWDIIHGNLTLLSSERLCRCSSAT